MRRNSVLNVCCALIVLLANSSCLENVDVYNPDRIRQEIMDSFDFSTTTCCPVEMSVGYKTLVTVYAEDPTTTAMPRPLYAAFTNQKGNYSGTMVIPSEYLGKTVYAYTLSFCIPALVTQEGIRFDRAQSRIVAPANGETNMQMSERLKDIYMNRLKENTNNSAIVPSGDAVIPITKDNTQLTASFVWSGASVGSKLYYYYYKTEVGSPETFNKEGKGCDIVYERFGNEKFHLFKDRADNGEIWNAWVDEKNNRYYCVGSTQDLLFYGENNELETGTPNFPAGYTVAFFIKMVRGSNNRPLYSEAYLNSWNDQGTWVHNQKQAGQFKDNESQSIIIGFEDLALRLFEDGKYTCDYDYNDVLFAVTTNFEHIDEEEIPDLVEEETESTENIEGTLLYEDLFPNEGDYDMNDVIIEYTLTKCFDTNNTLKRIDYEFTPVHDGASYTSDFSIMIDGYVETPIEIFKNHKSIIGNTYKGSITEAVAGKQKDEVSWEAFNPFITVGDSGYEVHLSKKRASANANTNGLDEFQKNYLSNNHGKEGDYPFAMNVPIKGFTPVTETQRIETNYPRYKEWAESKGMNSTDWYNYYKE